MRGTNLIVQNFYETGKLDGEQETPEPERPGSELPLSIGFEGVFPLVSLSSSTFSQSAKISRYECSCGNCSG